MGKLQNINLSGKSKHDGGKFASVNISGLGQILGDVEAEKIEISGIGTIKGTTKMQRFLVRVNANGTVEGPLEGSELDTSGNFKVSGPVKVKKIRNQGRAHFMESVQTNKVTCTGYLSVAQNLDAESFICSGSFATEGILKASKMEVEIRGFGYAREIRCQEILVKSPPRTSWHFWRKIISPFLGSNRKMDKLSSELLEGTNINICNTNAKIVRGSDIKIGPGCKIGEVEYTGKLEVDEKSVVGKQTKIG